VAKDAFEAKITAAMNGSGGAPIPLAIPSAIGVNSTAVALFDSTLVSAAIIRNKPERMKPGGAPSIRLSELEAISAAPPVDSSAVASATDDPTSRKICRSKARPACRIDRHPVSSISTAPQIAATTMGTTEKAESSTMAAKIATAMRALRDCGTASAEYSSSSRSWLPLSC